MWSFYIQIMKNILIMTLEQLNVASLSRPTVFLHCYSLLLLYCGQINDDDDDDDLMSLKSSKVFV